MFVPYVSSAFFDRPLTNTYLINIVSGKNKGWRNIYTPEPAYYKEPALNR